MAVANFESARTMGGGDRITGTHDASRPGAARARWRVEKGLLAMDMPGSGERGRKSHPRNEGPVGRASPSIVGELEQGEGCLDIALGSDREHHERVTIPERLCAPCRDECRAELLADGNMRLTAQVDVADLVLLNVEVGAIDLLLITQQPMGSSVHVGPGGKRLRNGLRGLG